MRRVTDTSIPEDEAFRVVEGLIVPVWEKATKENTRNSGMNISMTSFK